MTTSRYKRYTILLFMIIIYVPGSVSLANPSMIEVTACPNNMPSYNPLGVDNEKDNIFSLLAYAVVSKGWQDDSSTGTGYNVGSVLVDGSNGIVCWARNAVNITSNDTQHGEIRLMVNYLNNVKDVHELQSYKLYTTLEPCAMCAGMMTINNIELSVYGQAAPKSGNAFQRLELDSTSCGGYTSYYNPVISIPNQTGYPSILDSTYEKSGTTSIIEWLASPEAKTIFSLARTNLSSYTVQHQENQAIYDAAISFLANVPDGGKFEGFTYSVNCPGE